MAGRGYHYSMHSLTGSMHCMHDALTHPTGKSFVGTSNTSLPNISVSDMSPLNRFRSESCMLERSRAYDQWHRTRSYYACICSRTGTLYLTARPASVSILLTCNANRGLKRAVQCPRSVFMLFAHSHLVHNKTCIVYCRHI